MFVRRGARSAREPTAPSALTNPGLVLVKGSDRPGLQDERKGWIMSDRHHRCTACDDERWGSSARTVACRSAGSLIKGAALQQGHRQTASLVCPRDQGETWSARSGAAMALDKGARQVDGGRREQPSPSTKKDRKKLTRAKQGALAEEGEEFVSPDEEPTGPVLGRREGTAASWRW